MNFDRRGFLVACSWAGVTSVLFPGILYTLAAQAQAPADNTDQSKPPKITPEIIDAAALMAGIGPFTAEQKQMMIDGLVDQNGSCKAIRKLKLPNSVAPAFVFHPMPALKEGEDTRDCTSVMMQPDLPDINLACRGEIGEERATALVARSQRKGCSAPAGARGGP